MHVSGVLGSVAGKPRSRPAVGDRARWPVAEGVQEDDREGGPSQPRDQGARGEGAGETQALDGVTWDRRSRDEPAPASNGSHAAIRTRHPAKPRRSWGQCWEPDGPRPALLGSPLHPALTVDRRFETSQNNSKVHLKNKPATREAGDRR